MVLKKRGAGAFILLVLIVLTALLLLVVNDKHLSVAKEDLNQEIISLDLGFSSFRNLLDDGNKSGVWEKYSASEKIMAFFKNIPNVFKYKFSENKTPSVHVSSVDRSSLKITIKLC